MNKIFTRIFISYLTIGLSSALIITVIYYFIMRDALIERTYDQLSSINTLKKEQIDNYFTQTRKNIGFLFTHDFFLEHFHPEPSVKLTATEFPADVKKEIFDIRDLYNFGNIAVLDGELNEIFATTPGSMNFREVLESSGVRSQDSAFQILDASTSVYPKGTSLLYVVPLHHENALIVFEENMQKAQTILDENTGLGNTGETYLVGSDGRLRSASRFFPNRTPLDIVVKPIAEDDLDHIARDYRDVEVITVRRQLDPSALNWSIYSEIDLAEAMQPVDSLRNYLIIIALLLIIVTTIISALVSNAISKPILYLKGIIINLSKGVIPDKRAQVSNRDEIGQITDAINQLIGGLQRTTKFAYAIGEGRFDAPFEKLSEHDTLGDALIHMRDQIKSLNEKEMRLVREKSAAVMEGQENERTRITRELHDGVGQLLTVIRLRTERITGNDALVQEIKKLLADTTEEVKRISFNVMPSSLLDFGIEAALDGLSKQIGKVGRFEIDYQYIREVDRPLTFDIVVAVYRIAQEGLNNVLKHAGASHVSLHVLDKEDEVFMLLEDDGKGFDKRLNKNTGYGLRSMEERARLLGGSVDVHSEPAKGTAVEVHIPVKST